MSPILKSKSTIIRETSQQTELEKAIAYFGSARKTAEVIGISAPGFFIHRNKRLKEGDDLFSIKHAIKLLIASDGYIKVEVLCPDTCANIRDLDKFNLQKLMDASNKTSS